MGGTLHGLTELAVLEVVVPLVLEVLGRHRVALQTVRSTGTGGESQPYSNVLPNPFLKKNGDSAAKKIISICQCISCMEFNVFVLAGFPLEHFLVGQI